MTIKVLCHGEFADIGKSSWGGHAASVNVRGDGALVIQAQSGTRMGFRAGAWSKREPTGDYTEYDVDFSKRFEPRKMK